jgi:Na+-driven multidrug efflux pump
VGFDLFFVSFLPGFFEIYKIPGRNAPCFSIDYQLSPVNFQTVNNLLHGRLFMTSVISVIFTVVAIFLGRTLMRMFTPTAEIIEVGYEYLVIVSAFYLVFALMFCLNAVYRGAGDTIVPMFITLLALWLVRIPISWYLSGEMGPKGIWWGIPLAWIAGFVLSLIYYFTGLWKKHAVVKIGN